MTVFPACWAVSRRGPSLKSRLPPETILQVCAVKQGARPAHDYIVSIKWKEMGPEGRCVLSH